MSLNITSIAHKHNAAKIALLAVDLFICKRVLNHAEPLWQGKHIRV